VYRRLADLSPRRFLFESVTGGERISRYSFLGAGPRETYRLYLDRLEIDRDGEVETRAGDPLAELRRLVSGVEAPSEEIPFLGGFVGYFGFDLVRMIERLVDPPPDPFGLPVAQLSRFDRLVVFDHARQRVLGVANEIEGEVDTAEARAGLDELAELLTRRAEGGGAELPAPENDGPAAEPSLSDADYARAVERVQKYIAAGDIFQAVIARRWRLHEKIDPLALYRALRMVNPSPYMVLLESPEVSLAGASPEMLVRKSGRKIETRPIAGTRPRGSTAVADERLAEELLADPKERAEHVMLVDLGRNDVGRVSAAGSVEVSTFMEVERYSHVMHIVSEVQGALAEDADGFDALLSCFPAGTVSGAPKIRAMQIIDELEPETRGPYAGAVGYLSYSGDLDTCITIRTLVAHGNEVWAMAGAGIVADSDPMAEARETENKAAALLAAAELARRLRS
jgi:anthranilate synthase component 1